MKKTRKPRVQKPKSVYIDEDYVQALEELQADPLYDIKKKILSEKKDWWKAIDR